MPEKYWFARKQYGYGWTPSTWQGWLAFSVVMAVTVGGAVVLAASKPSGPVPVVIYLVVVAVAVSALLMLTIRKGPPARWQWGENSDD